jgi:hypothetical protein
LHDLKGGLLRCPLCIGAWHGEHGRRRKLGRIVIRAISAFLEGGGEIKHLEKLKIAAITGGSCIINLDPLGYLNGVADNRDEEILLTTELLADVLRLVHPDLHPPERQDLARRVTQGLLALQPFTFPAAKPKPEPINPPSVAAATDRSPPKKQTYPCPDCADTVPYFYCDTCKAEWDRQREKEREKEREQRRRWAANRKARRQPKLCAACMTVFSGKRTDARFCSATCRQRGHRAVTAKKRLCGRPTKSRDTDLRANGGAS